MQRLSANFKNTLHPSPKLCKCLCMSCFGRVKSAFDSSPTLHPPFTRKICVILKTEQVKNLRHLRNLRDLLQRPNSTIAVLCKYYRCAL